MYALILIVQTCPVDEVVQIDNYLSVKTSINNIILINLKEFLYKIMICLSALAIEGFF